MHFTGVHLSLQIVSGISNKHMPVNQTGFLRGRTWIQ